MIAEKKPVQNPCHFLTNPEWLPGRKPDKTFRNKTTPNGNKVTTGTNLLGMQLFQSVARCEQQNFRQYH